MQISLAFRQFDMGGSGDCLQDYLTLSDGSNTRYVASETSLKGTPFKVD